MTECSAAPWLPSWRTEDISGKIDEVQAKPGVELTIMDRCQFLVPAKVPQ